MSRVHLIYKTTCLVTGRYYIGMHSTANLEDGYLGSGKLLHRSLKKYGRDSHTREVLFYAPDRAELSLLEKSIVTSEMLNDSMCMNIRPGGDGGFSTEERKRGRIAFKMLMQNVEWRQNFCKSLRNAAINNPELYKRLQQTAQVAALSPKLELKELRLSQR